MSTRLHALALLTTLTTAGCAETDSKKKSVRGPTPAEDFAIDTTVRIIHPSHGGRLSSPFTMSIETGSSIDQVEVLANSVPVSETVIDHTDARTELVIDLPSDNYNLQVRGFDATGTQVSTYMVAVHVLDEVTVSDPWVLITSPRNDTRVANPVAFTVEASPGVDTVEYFADEWSIGTSRPGEVLRYEFSGTDYARSIEVVAYDDGEPVATDDLTITVTEGTTPGDSDVNDIILSYLSEYPTDGSYTYWWPDDSYGWGGNPSDIYYQGDLFAQGDDRNRSYCVGITFEVFMRTFDHLDAAYDLDGDLNGVSFDELYDFRTDWYVRDLYGMGIVDAMDNYGVGARVTDWADVRPGDIIQFWRHSGSGHNAIFIGWETNTVGDIAGFTYWSTQSSTDGIGYNHEAFGTSGSRVDPNFFFAGRLYSPEDWTPWW